MSLQNFLKLLREEDNEKHLQKIIDSILDFIIIKTPKTIAKSVQNSYSWMVDFYKENCDKRTLSKLLQEKEKGKKFCEIDYKAGEIVCKYSKLFYNKEFMKYFCEKYDRAPNSFYIIKRNNSHFHKGYCICSEKERNLNK
ncbi:MAG: hypothetical protein QW622_02740 [Candidatus Pacearchaeota archaeon]